MTDKETGPEPSPRVLLQQSVRRALTVLEDITGELRAAIDTADRAALREADPTVSAGCIYSLTCTPDNLCERHEQLR